MRISHRLVQISNKYVYLSSSVTYNNDYHQERLHSCNLYLELNLQPGKLIKGYSCALGVLLTQSGCCRCPVLAPASLLFLSSVKMDIRQI